MSAPDLDLTEVFHAEYRRLTSGGRDQDEDVREDALASAIGAVEEAVRERVAREIEESGMVTSRVRRIAAARIRAGVSS